MTNPTKQDKILAIAKAMYGDKATVNALGKVVLPVEHGQHGVRAFNPYVSSVDSQAVQIFFKINTSWINKEWEAYHSLECSIHTSLNLLQNIGID